MEKGKRFYTLDFLKFVGALLILQHHYQLNTGLLIIGGKFYWGFIVEFFFLVSGFLAVNSIEKVKQQSFGKFLINKFSRLYPMAIVTVLGYAVGEWIFYRLTGLWYRDVDVGLWNLLASGLLIFQGGPIGNIDLGANNPVWYLCVLLICYVIYYGLVKLAQKLKVSPAFFFIFMIFVGLSVNTYGLSLPYFNSYTARGYFAFFFGAFLYYIIAVVPKKQSILVSLIVLVVVALPKLIHYPELYDNSQMIATFLVYPSIVTLFINSEWLNKVLGNKISGYLGGVSYEIYLWHGPCLVVQGILLATGVLQGVTYKTLVCFVLITLTISCFMFSVVEKKLYQKMYHMLDGFFDRVIKFDKEQV